MKGVRLNKRTIDAAAYQGKGADYRWDSELSGFGLRVYPSGRKSFVVTYRVRGNQRFFTIGRYGEMSCRNWRNRAELRITLCRIRGGRRGWRRPGRRRRPL